jgi:hypothetical protein
LPVKLSIKSTVFRIINSAIYDVSENLQGSGNILNPFPIKQVVKDLPGK